MTRIIGQIVPTEIVECFAVEYKDADPDCIFCGGKGSHNDGAGCFCTVEKWGYRTVKPPYRPRTIIVELDDEKET